MASATIVGGNSVSLSLSDRDAIIAKDALTALSSRFSSSNIMPSDDVPPSSSPGSLDVYNVDSAIHGKVISAPGAEAVVIRGSEGVRIEGTADTRLIAGGRGNDTINAGGGNATIIGGAGNDLIQLADRGKPGGSAFISLSGEDTVRLWGGTVSFLNTTPQDGRAEIELNSGENHVTVDGAARFDINGGTNSILSDGGAFTVTGGNSTVTVSGRSANIVKTGGAQLDLTLQSPQPGHYDLKGDMAIHQTAEGRYRLELDGNDTVWLGGGNDTIASARAATVFGGSGALDFSGGRGADSVLAGTGRATILGGAGNDTIIGGSGFMRADGGAGADQIVGSSLRDTLTGGAGRDVFRFAATAAGGQHVVTDFVQGVDRIDLSGGGYSMADIAQTSVHAGSTVIRLQDGTQITLKNFTHLQNSDFI